MPGASLWLLPPRGHPLDAALINLIARTAEEFGSPHTFLPHVTLTSDITADAYTLSPQAWLDALPLPTTLPQITLGPLASDPIYVRKLYSRLPQSPSLTTLTRATRSVVQPNASDLQTWLDETWSPHLSLLYHDCPVVDEERRREVEGWRGGEGVRIDGQGEEGMGGWTGGRVVLVETWRAIGEWVPVAERVL